MGEHLSTVHLYYSGAFGHVKPVLNQSKTKGLPDLWQYIVEVSVLDTAHLFIHCLLFITHQYDESRRENIRMRSIVKTKFRSISTLTQPVYFLCHLLSIAT